METLSTTKKTQALDARRFVAGEVNLSRLPFFASSTKGLKKKISIEYRHIAQIGGREVEVLWEVTANAKYGYPGPSQKPYTRPSCRLLPSTASPSKTL